MQLELRIDLEQLELLQKIINNSVVGTSKLLHFINPEQYPIIDSRVCEFLFGSSMDKLATPQFYMEYMQFMKGNLLKHNDSEKVLNELKSKISEDITLMRALEFCMYGIAVNKSKIEREIKNAS